MLSNAFRSEKPLHNNNFIRFSRNSEAQLGYIWPTVSPSYLSSLWNQGMSQEEIQLIKGEEGHKGS